MRGFRTIAIALTFVVALSLGMGVRPSAQSPFLIYGSSSGANQVIKATSNALWVSCVSGCGVSSFPAALVIGTGGGATTTSILGTPGTFGIGQTGTGILGVGAAAVPGIALYASSGTAAITAGETIAGWYDAINSPGSAAANGTGVFGLVTFGSWIGSTDSSAEGLVYGAQNTARVQNTASVKNLYGAENVAVSLATAGTAVTATGTWSHVENNSTGAITNGRGLFAQLKGAFTTGFGIDMDFGNVASATTLYGIRIGDVTQGTTNYALYTGLGAARFGGALTAASLTSLGAGAFTGGISAASATIPQLLGPSGASIDIGDGTATAQATSLRVLGTTGQSQALLTLSIAGATKFSIDSLGSMNFVNDLNFNSNTAFWGSPQNVRIGSGVIDLASTSRIRWALDGTASNTKDTGLTRGAAGVLEVNTGTAGTLAAITALNYRINGGNGAASSTQNIQKSVTAIADATATSILTITIPNAAHSANVLVRIVGSLGAGGAVGANEASASNSYLVTITRTAGVNAVAAISATFGASAAAVAGAATVTATVDLGSVVGAVGASNTIPIRVTITHSGGSSANHTCQVYAEVLNANATGIAVA